MLIVTPEDSRPCTRNDDILPEGSNRLIEGMLGPGFIVHVLIKHDRPGRKTL
jgi:hypothetical protein